MRGKAASASSLAGAARAFGRHYVRYSFGLSYLVFWCSSYRWVGLLKGLVIVAVRRFAIAWVSGGDGFSSGLYDSLHFIVVLLRWGAEQLRAWLCRLPSALIDNYQYRSVGSRGSTLLLPPWLLAILTSFADASSETIAECGLNSCQRLVDLSKGRWGRGVGQPFWFWVLQYWDVVMVVMAM